MWQPDGRQMENTPVRMWANMLFVWVHHIRCPHLPTGFLMLHMGCIFTYPAVLSVNYHKKSLFALCFSRLSLSLPAKGIKTVSALTQKYGSKLTDEQVT